MSVEGTVKHAVAYDGGVIVMTDENTMLTKCGNGLKFTSIVNNSQHFLTRPKSARITAFDAHVKTGQIAVAAHEENAEVAIYSLAEKKFRGKFKIATGDSVFEYSMVRFSRCGSRLLSIGTHMEHQIRVWDVDKFEALDGCLVTVSQHVLFASFCPLNADNFVTGRGEGITFWRVCKGRASTYRFSRVDGALSHESAQEQKVVSDVAGINDHRLFPTPADASSGDRGDDDLILEKRHQYICHCWTKAGTLYVTNQLGELLTFDPSTGSVLAIVTLSHSAVAVALQLTSENLIVAFSDNSMRWITEADSSVSQAVALPAKIATVALTPACRTLVLGTATGAIFHVSAILDDEDKTSSLVPLGAGHQGAILTLSVLIPSGGTTNDAVIVSGGTSGFLHITTVVGCRHVMVADLQDLFDVNKSASTSPTIHYAITSIATRYLDPIVLVGDASGRLRILGFAKAPLGSGSSIDISPLHNLRVTATSALDLLEIHPSLPLALVGSSYDSTILVLSLEPEKHFRVVGYVRCTEGPPTLLKWVPTSSLESTYFVTATASKLFYCPLINMDDRGTTELKLVPLGNTAIPSPCHGGSFLLAPGKILAAFDRTAKAVHIVKVFDAPGSEKDHEFKLMEATRTHQKPVTCLARGMLSSKDGHEIIATGGADGAVVLWLVQTKRSSSAVHLKDIELDLHKQKNIALHAGAVTSLTFATCDENLYLYSTGVDGAVFCIDLKFLDGLIMSKSVAEGASPLYAALLAKDKTYGKVRLALADDAKPFMTKYVEEQEQLERAKFDAVKDNIRGPLAEIQLKLKTMLQHNADVPEIEALAREEFVINKEQESALLAQNATRAMEVRRNISRQIAEMNIVRERMKNEFWDSSDAKGKQLHGLQATTLKVYNIPTRKLSKLERRQQDTVQQLRRLEFHMATVEPTQSGSDSLHRRKSSLYHHGDLIPPNISWMANAGLLHPSIVRRGADATTGDKSKAGAAPNSKRDEDSGESGPVRLVDLIYHPAMIRTRKQQRTQMHLLKAYKRLLINDFNAEFDEMVKLKETKMDEIEAKNGRIREISAELQIIEHVNVYSWHPDEIADSMMRLAEGEMTKTPYETEAMRKAREAAEAAQRELAEKNKKDDVAGRALDDMMHGTLETKKEMTVAQIAAREAWMDEIPLDEMTAEQKQKVQAYEAEAAKILEEKEKYKKSLDLELKKLKVDIIDICKAFDDKLKQLHDLYLATRMSVLTQQMYILRLGDVIMEHEYSRYEKMLLEKEIDKIENEIKALTADASEFETRMEICREEWHRAVEEDKQHEKAFVKEIEDAAGIPLEHEVLRTLTELYRKRRNTEGDSREEKKGRKMTELKGSSRNLMAAETEVESSCDPFSHIDTKKKKHEVKRILPLDPDVDRPESISTDSPVWNALNDCRAKKITSEQVVKAKNDAYVEAKEVVESTEAKLAILQDKVDRYTQALHELEVTLNLNSENHPILIKIKQGQDEASGDDVVELGEETESALLICRSSVEKLNSTILVHGNEQVSILTKIKNFRKNINLMEWEHEYLEMQKRNMEDHYTDLQLLRVTKNLQELITTGDATQKQKQEQALLESKLAYLGKSHQVHEVKLNKTTMALKSQLGERLKENEQFKRQLQDLQTHIQIREDIVASRRANASVKSTSGKPKDNKLKAITVRRKLVDLAKAQSEEIEFMRQELDKIRRRTFPSFVQPVNALPPDDIFDD
ncbi:hypothetical protein LEN26_007550 [Aphanomyces euteiches]|nr:hypothetical protein AeMF1_016119 [Aphanomyces euteiches]KAH9131954.1 hypothetical protein LEN26_007550 [Aphanomyces euteiches]KAH9191696.1 hypothetical protein AeNC1_006326 [Aphanomyces euteiches]